MLSLYNGVYSRVDEEESGEYTVIYADDGEEFCVVNIFEAIGKQYRASFDGLL